MKVIGPFLNLRQASPAVVIVSCPKKRACGCTSTPTSRPGMLV